jgi:hypothetical protein
MDDQAVEEQVVQEKRRYTRHEYSGNLRFQRCSGGKLMPARSVNVSSGGMLLNVLAGEGLYEGQLILLDLPAHYARLAPDDVKLPFLQSVPATIVRIERGDLKTNGYMSIGVRFSHA